MAGREAEEVLEYLALDGGTWNLDDGGATHVMAHACV